ncbi:MAG TPA: hypothetical protein VF278_23710 [Pirellulales bacterium]
MSFVVVMVVLSKRLGVKRNRRKRAPRRKAQGEPPTVPNGNKEIDRKEKV